MANDDIATCQIDPETKSIKFTFVCDKLPDAEAMKHLRSALKCAVTALFWEKRG